jgi:hypothetical protein
MPSKIISKKSPASRISLATENDAASLLGVISASEIQTILNLRAWPRDLREGLQKTIATTAKRYEVKPRLVLAGASAQGVIMSKKMTSKHRPLPLSNDETEVLRHFRAGNIDVQQMMLPIIRDMAQLYPARPTPRLALVKSSTAQGAHHA